MHLKDSISRVSRLVLCTLCSFVSLCHTAVAGIKLTDAPQFTLRARVLQLNGATPDPNKAFQYRLGGVKSQVTSTGRNWSPLLLCDIDGIRRALKLYPNIYLRRYPLVFKLQTHPAGNSIKIEVEIRWHTPEPVPEASGPQTAELKTEENGIDEALDDAPPALPPANAVLRAELFGPTLGFLVWRNKKHQPQVATMTQYNHRFWKFLDQAKSAGKHPRHFPIVDRFIGGDNDRADWEEGIHNLVRAGFSVVMLPPSASMHQILKSTGLTRTAWAIYSPIGYAFDYNPKITPQAIDAWAEKLAAPYKKAGSNLRDIAMYAMGDEPGWYFPKQLKAINPLRIDRFHDYLRDQGLKPQDVGAATWDQVLPIARDQAKDLPSKRLFYWSARFLSWDSARHYARCTRAMEKAFYPGILVFANWNFFSGRFYFPGAFGHNPDKNSPGCAMGSHDWMEFGRMRGTTLLWTEDWFGDSRAWQWSFYCSKLNSAARKGKIKFGGYVVPRTCGSRKDGILQRILTIVGSGGKALEYFVFGPEYNFPGNCYSFKSNLLPRMAEAHGMITDAEDLLWPGKRPPSPVAFLHPRSAELWDAWGVATRTGIVDATNTVLDSKTVDYMAEVFDLYQALQHANQPVDWVEEDDLEMPEKGLKNVRVLYVTEPNLPRKAIRGLLQWVKNGGTLVTVANAATRDRYNENCKLMEKIAGIHDDARPPLLVPSVHKLKKADRIKGKSGIVAVGPVIQSACSKSEILASFENDTPALYRKKLGKGTIFHFPWMPGMSYAVTGTKTRNGLPVGFSTALRKMITRPVREAGIIAPVQCNLPQVETPLLLSPAGAAVTVLNWTGKKQTVELTIRLPFRPASVTAVKAGKLTFKTQNNSIHVKIPLGAADILMLPAKK